MTIADVPVEVRGPLRISNSEIQTFKDCRRKWWLSYYRRLQPKTQQMTGALALGSRVHGALDLYYAQNIPLLEAHASLVASDKQILIDSYRDTVDLDSEAELGRIMLEGYLEWVTDNGIDAELEMISTEEVISMPLFAPLKCSLVAPAPCPRIQTLWLLVVLVIVHTPEIE